MVKEFSLNVLLRRKKPKQMTSKHTSRYVIKFDATIDMTTIKQTLPNLRQIIKKSKIELCGIDCTPEFANGLKDQHGVLSVVPDIPLTFAHV